MLLNVTAKNRKSPKQPLIIEIRNGEERSFGREKADCVFRDDLFMSRPHFAIRFEQGKVELIHLSSSNPTAIQVEDGKIVEKLKEPQTLRTIEDGEMVLAGSYRFQFETVGEGESTNPSATSSQPVEAIPIDPAAEGLFDSENVSVNTTESEIDDMDVISDIQIVTTNDDPSSAEFNIADMAHEKPITVENDSSTVMSTPSYAAQQQEGSDGFDNVAPQDQSHPVPQFSLEPDPAQPSREPTGQSENQNHEPSNEPDSDSQKMNAEKKKADKPNRDGPSAIDQNESSTSVIDDDLFDDISPDEFASD